MNFGCPAKTVNKSDGGACLLRTPGRLYDIVSAVRQALPAEISVSAKIRLGFEDRSGYLECAQACAEGGAGELVVHGRSKADGYRPPAYWDCIGHIRQAVDIPVVANGEIWTLEDYRRCVAQSGCTDVMLGRGLLARPDLALQIKAAQQGRAYQPRPWHWALQQLYRYYQTSLPLYPIKYAGNRIKQWLMYLRTAYPEADIFFETIKKERNPEVLSAIFQRQLSRAETGSLKPVSHLQARFRHSLKTAVFKLNSLSGTIGPQRLN